MLNAKTAVIWANLQERIKRVNRELLLTAHAKGMSMGEYAEWHFKEHPEELSDDNEGNVVNPEESPFEEE